MKPLLPMLATPAAPFDSEAYLFEVKWDGVRTLAAMEAGRWRLWGRTGTDYTARYPELAILGRLPTGTMVDGELVVLRGGRADFPALLPTPVPARRSPLCGSVPPAAAGPLCALRSALRPGALCHAGSARPATGTLAGVACGAGRAGPGVLRWGGGLRAGVLCPGGSAGARRGPGQGPGQPLPARTALRAWRKIKPVGMLPCVLAGYRPGRHGIGRLLLATVQEGQLRYVGQVRHGGDHQAGVALLQRLAARRREQPLVRCPLRACWVEPVLYCQVKHHGWTTRGQLRLRSSAA